MSLTPNFGFNIPTGTDTVNLLTQCYPNFTSLDTILQAIKESGVSTATATKSGSTHQIVRTVSDCDIFRFVATANYNSGDLFTVDGSPVTATAVNGTSLPSGAFVINQSVLCILNGSVLTVAVAGAGDAQNIGYDNTGSGLTASNVQDAIDEIVADIPTGFAATAISYDNTGSGLLATDVQDAIDALASASLVEHGLYELWPNPDPGQDYSTGTITILNFDKTQYDQIELDIAVNKNESNGVKTIRVEVPFFDNTTLTVNSVDCFIAGPRIVETIRPFQINLTGTTLTINVSTCTYYTLQTYGQSPTSVTDNAYEVPVRILGLKHNE